VSCTPGRKEMISLIGLSGQVCAWAGAKPRCGCRAGQGESHDASSCGLPVGGLAVTANSKTRVRVTQGPGADYPVVQRRSCHETFSRRPSYLAAAALAQSQASGEPTGRSPSDRHLVFVVLFVGFLRRFRLDGGGARKRTRRKTSRTLAVSGRNLRYRPSSSTAVPTSPSHCNKSAANEGYILAGLAREWSVVAIPDDHRGRKPKCAFFARRKSAEPFRAA